MFFKHYFELNRETDNFLLNKHCNFKLKFNHNYDLFNMIDSLDDHYYRLNLHASYLVSETSIKMEQREYRKFTKDRHKHDELD